MAGLHYDALFASRQLRRSAGFSVVAALTLGLGIGAAVIIFSIARAVILRPLPFPDAERLVRVEERNPDGDPFSIAEANFVDFRDRNRTFLELAALSVRRMPMLGGGEPLQVQGMVVSDGFFETLGVNAELGRTFTAADYPVGAEGDVAVIGHGLWERMFGSDPGVLGRTVNVDGTARTVIGVTPPTLTNPFGADVWIPFGPDPASTRHEHVVEAVGKLQPGVTVEDAHADLGAIAEQLGAEHPSTNQDWGVRIRTFEQWIIGPRPARVVGVLSGAVLLLLLLACASVSNLVIARSTSRQREIAVRTALGAGRARIVRQFLFEGLFLSLLGAGIGLGIARAAVPVIRRINADALPRLSEIGVEPGAFVFACILAILATVLFGMGPALQATGQQLAPGLMAGSRVLEQGARRVRDALVVGQLALALILLVGAGLLAGSFLRLASVDPGFKADNVLTIRISPRGDRYPPFSPAVSHYYRDLEARIEAVPGVVAAGASIVDPFRGMRPANRVGPAGATEEQDMVDIQLRAVTPGFFRAMNIPLLRGRYLEEDDNDIERLLAAERDDLEYEFNALVSPTLAERLWPGRDPIGKRFVWGQPGGPLMKVVGVVGEVRDIALAERPEPMAYLPNGLVAWSEMVLMVRTNTDPAALAGPLRTAIWSVDPDTPVPGMRALQENVDFELSGSRLNVQLVGIFAAAALLLATLGLYGIVAYSVSRRTREMGVRIALGARPGRVARLVLQQGGRLIVLGLLLGTLGALLLSRFMTRILFEIRPTNAVTYVAVAALLAAVAFLATWIPARRAVRVDPRIALTAE